MISNPNIYSIVFSGIVALILSLVITKYAIKILINKNILDQPSARRAHSLPTPRGGGIAIVLAFCISYIIYSYINNDDIICTIQLLLPLLIIASISLFDDLYEVSIIIRLFIHICTATYVLHSFLAPTTLFHNEIPYALDMILAILGLVGFLNIYNFLDGIDGITASQAIHLSIVLLILCYLRYEQIHQVNLIIIIATLVLASSLGFMKYNWHPAKIFLGDVGSITLGFLLGLCLIIVASGSFRLFLAINIASLYYSSDGLLTIMIRLMNGEKIWLPHLKHFFQKAARNGMSHDIITKKIIICNICLMTLSISSLYYPIISSILAILTVTMLLIHFSKCNK